MSNKSSCQKEERQTSHATKKSPANREIQIIEVRIIEVRLDVSFFELNDALRLV